MTNKLLSYGGFVLQVLTLILIGFVVFSQGILGAWNTTNFDQVDTTDGYSVDGTSIIDGSGIFTGTVSSTAEARLSLVETGSITTLTPQATATAVTLTAAQVCDSNQIRWDITTVSTTLNLPTVANTVADCLKTNGDTVQLLFSNISTSTGAIATIASSTWELIGVGAGSDLIDGGNQARITLQRTSSTAGYAILEEMIAAD